MSKNYKKLFTGGNYPLIKNTFPANIILDFYIIMADMGLKNTIRQLHTGTNKWQIRAIFTENIQSVYLDICIITENWYLKNG